MRAFAPNLGPIQAKGFTRTGGFVGPNGIGTGAKAAATGFGGHRFSDIPALPKNHSTGGRMPADVQEKMERHFGYDFSAVRIHQDSRAADMGARAYAQGPNLHFAPGAYDPRGMSGQRLLGHELAHVVQQAQGRVRVPAQAKGDESINDDPALEREADRMGADAARASEEDDGGQPKEDLAARLRRLETGGGGNQPVQRKVTVPAKTKLPDFDQYLTRSGDTYSYPRPIRTSGELSLEIFTSLFNSPRDFKLKGAPARRLKTI